MTRGNQKGNTHNAGRKEGSVNLPKFESYFTGKEIVEFMANLKVRAKKSDKLAVFVAEHLFGKAIQPIGNPDGSPLVLKFDPVFNVTSP